jgi:hypothetical protein
LIAADCKSPLSFDPKKKQKKGEGPEPKSVKEQQEELRCRMHALIYDWIQRCNSVLQKLNLPQHQVPFLQPRSQVGGVHPQVSYMQSQLLNWAPDVVAVCNQSGPEKQQCAQECQ